MSFSRSIANVGPVAGAAKKPTVFLTIVAMALKNRNQAAEENRRSRIWWCFYPPRHAGQSGIGTLLGAWGGEALYNWHHDDAIMGPILRSIGTPSLIEATVPINLLNQRTSLALKIIAQYLRQKNKSVADCFKFNGNIGTSLPAINIRQIILYPEPAFLELTGCATWHKPIGPRLM